jgi:hypothetical protein
MIAWCRDFIAFGGPTYTPPRAKTIIKPTFCFFGSLRADSAGIGSVRIAMSVAMFMTAFPKQTGCSGKQYLLVMVLSQKYGTGLHMKIALTTLHMPYPTTMAKMIQHVRRIRVATKTRRYCRMMDILAKVSVAR